MHLTRDNVTYRSKCHFKTLTQLKRIEIKIVLTEYNKQKEYLDVHDMEGSIIVHKLVWSFSVDSECPNL